MPTWGEILAELTDVLQRTGTLPYDGVRRRYLTLLNQKTGRNVILYATRWTQTDMLTSPEAVAITVEDIQGLMEVVRNLDGSKGLDLILHSPRGSAEATEAFVCYIRTKFDDVRVIIPQGAMSAATMLACSANSIMIGKHSSIGPIDPQIILETQAGIKSIPTQDILDQFELAKEQCVDPNNLGSWMPLLGQYWPGLLVQCDNAIMLSRKLVSDWLAKYMFGGKNDAKKSLRKSLKPCLVTDAL